MGTIVEQAPASATARYAGWWRWIVVLAPGVLLSVIAPVGLTISQSRLLGIFLSTILALIARPVPTGVTVIVAIAVLGVTRTLSPENILSGFSNPTVWLTVTAFLFAHAVTATGVGNRVGYLFIRLFAHTPLRLGYAVAAADLSLAPFIPSDTARGGGIIFPITVSLSQVFGSKPGPTARRMGTFLMLTAFHATYTASAMFLTGMAANPLIAEFAYQTAHVRLTWVRWFNASAVPGLLALLVVPYVISLMFKPEIQNTEPARHLAACELERMGPLKRSERWLVLIIVAVMIGWITSPWHGVSNTFVALGGLAAMLLSKVISWEELLAEHRAWDTLIWFGPLIMMSDALNRAGLVALFSNKLFAQMHGWRWALVLVALVSAYLYIHYTFASMTAHATALYSAFLGAALVGGVPPLVAALALAFFSNLNAGITHYGTGSAPVYFGAGYVSQADWWRTGFLISVLNLMIWLGVGIWWWKLIGLW
ncbi:MAG: DASS family sodium-coupled anion symporter [Acidobacteriaceae bacterium]|nr:DASS family sodium-coupled anion symporter [Acidobacteriaceae bacterium]